MINATRAADIVEAFNKIRRMLEYTPIFIPTEQRDVVAALLALGATFKKDLENE